MSTLERATTIYSLFRSKEGAEHIARPVSILAVMNMCERDQPTSVIEIGAGIGALSYAVLATSRAHLYTYEENEFCRTELGKNLAMYEGRYTLLYPHEACPPHEKEMLLIDGKNLAGLEYDYKTVFIEGCRWDQRAAVRRGLLKHRKVWEEFIYEDIVFEGVRSKGGIEFFHIRSSSVAASAWCYLQSILTTVRRPRGLRKRVRQLLGFDV